MGLSLAGLGAGADGAMQGWMRGQAINDLNKRREDADKERAKADKLQADMDSANKAAVERLESFRPQHPAARPIGSADVAGPATPQAAAWSPSREQILDAARARTDKLFELGQTDHAVKQWIQDDGMRRQMRADAAERGMLSWKTSGDPTELLSGVYKHLDDGWELKGITPGVDGKFTVERVNAKGETRSNSLAPQQIEGLVQVAMDPKNALLYALKEKLALYEGDQRRETERVKAEEDRKTEGAKNQYGLAKLDREHGLKVDLEKTKSGLQMREIGARGAEERRTKATPGAPDSEFTLGEGQERFRRNKDGSLASVAKGGTKATSGKVDWTGLASKHFGDTQLGALGGNKTASPGTLALAVSAQEIYEANKDRAGMTPEKAIELAGKAHGK